MWCCALCWLVVDTNDVCQWPANTIAVPSNELADCQYYWHTMLGDCTKITNNVLCYVVTTNRRWRYMLKISAARWQFHLVEVIVFYRSKVINTTFHCNAQLSHREADYINLDVFKLQYHNESTIYSCWWIWWSKETRSWQLVWVHTCWSGN